MQKFKKFILIGLVIALTFSLVLPQQAFAGLIPGPFDYFEMISENVEEVASPIMSRIITIFTFYGLGLVALHASAAILDNVISAQPTWLTLDNNMVQEGWHFTAGLANMLMILILIFIAIQIILKVETFASKKTLTKLFLVAFLLNFSLLFINLILDVTDVFYDSILNSVKSFSTQEGAIFANLIDVLTGGSSSVARNFATLIGGWAASSLVPGLGATRQFIISSLFIVSYLPLIINWLIEAVFFFLLSAMFAVLIFVFSARVYIIQILAILSPLAFICLILPQTEKYWKQWLNTLIEWSICGIFFLFLLALMCAGINYLMPPNIGNSWIAAIPFLSWKGIGAQVVFYFSAFIFLFVILSVGKKTIPSMTQGLINMATNIGKTMWTSGLKPLGKTTRENFLEGTAKSKTMEKWATLPTPELKGAKKLLSPFAIPAYATARRIGQTLGPGALDAQKKKIAEAQKKSEGIQDPNLELSKYLDAMARGDTTNAIGIANDMIKKGGPFKNKIIKELQRPDEKNPDLIKATALAKNANDLGDAPSAERIARAALSSKVSKENREKILGEMGFKLNNDDIAKGYKTTFEKLVAEAKNDDIKIFNKDIWNDPEVIKTVKERWNGSQLSQAAKEFSNEFTESFNKSTQEDLKKIKTLPDPQAEETFKTYVRQNPRISRYLETSAAQEIGLGSIYAGAPDHVKEKYDKKGGIRAILAEPSSEERMAQKKGKDEENKYRFDIQ